MEKTLKGIHQLVKNNFLFSENVFLDLCYKRFFNAFHYDAREKNKHTQKLVVAHLSQGGGLTALAS